KRWPSRDKARCVKSFGFDLMAGGDYHWRLSFLRAERHLLDAMEHHADCRIKCLRLVRQLTEDVWCPGPRPLINAHHLQMLLLWECQRRPSSRSWLDLAQCFLRLIRRLMRCSQRFLRHFFVRRANLLKYSDSAQLDALADTLHRFLESPSLSMLQSTA
ncbi:LOW QUALITY PROTEIN: protein mab-21-like 3, partial [Gastrophryne carolinensis]